ncbi:AAA family ATPase [Streptomyces sp. NPDC001941]|uniref:AAA family ATPase n=1 Tax=Streptomyces sp. NPDC001941 TaxID=3154659 RepID=UPI00332C21A8
MGVRSLVIGAGGFPARVVTEDELASGRAAFGPLPSVDRAVEGVARALARAGTEAARPLLDPDRDGLYAAWRDALGRAGGDPLVVHFSGHGAAGVGDGLYLAVRGSDPASLRATAVEVDGLLKDVEGGAGGPVLFLLDVCGAGKAVASQLAHRISGTDRRAWVVAACAGDQATSGARFSRATTFVLDRLARGWLDVSPALEYVPVDTFAAEVDRELGRTAVRDGAPGQAVVRTTHEEAVVSPPPFFRNPAHASDAENRFVARTDAALRQFAIDSDPGLDLMHFAARASGTSRADSCLFSGRASQLRRLRDWMDDPIGAQEPLLVITGGPGSGKSALLGVSVCLTHPALKPLRPRIVTRVRGFRPRPDAKVVAVHARQLSTEQIVRSLLNQLAPQQDRSAQAHLRASGTADRVRHLPGAVGELVTELRRAGRTLVVLDALDEAADPAAVLRDLVQPLLGGPGAGPAVPGCRILIGTRPWWDTLQELHRVATERPGRIMDLDAQSREELTADLTDYLGDLLYPHYGSGSAAKIAHRLAYNAEHGAFLIASLYADHLLGEAAAGRMFDDLEVTRSLPCDITQMFDLHVAGLVRARPWTGPVLWVLGRARGQGMPLDLLHHAASALAPSPGDALVPTLQDSREALTHASFYLRTSVDSDHRLLYRYFHQALTDHTRSATDAGKVLAALLDTVPSGPDGARLWALAPPYLRRHAAAHAVDAGPAALDALLEDPGFLLHADPDQLVPLLRFATSPTAVRHAHIYRTSTGHHPERHLVGTRRDLLALDAAAWRAPGLARRLATTELDHRAAPTVPRWATSSTADPARLHSLTGHTAAVHTVHVVPREDGGLLAVSASGAETVAWDLPSGSRLGEYAGVSGSALSLTVHGDHGIALLATPKGARSLAPASGVALLLLRDHELRTWDPVTGGLLSTLSTLSAQDDFAGLFSACGLADGRTVAVMPGSRNKVNARETGSGSWLFSLDGHDRPCIAVHALSAGPGPALAVTASATEAIVWDLDARRKLPRLVALHQRLTGVALARLPDGRAVAVTVANRGPAVVWDALTGRRDHTLGEDPHPAQCVATVTLPDGRALAVTGYDAAVALWDLATGERLRTLTGAPGRVVAVSASALADGTLFVTAASRDLVVVWRVTGDESQEPLRGAGGGVNALAVAPEADGRTALVAAEADGALSVRDLADGEHLRSLTTHTRGATSLAVERMANGRWAAVSTGLDKQMHVRDISTGESLHSATAHPQPVNAVRTLRLSDGRVVAITTAHREASVWDLASGRRLRTLAGLHGRAVNALACALLPDGRPCVVTASYAEPLVVRNPGSGSWLGELTGHKAALNALDTAPGGAGGVLVIGGGDEGHLFVWELTAPDRPRRIPLHRRSIRALATTELPGHGTVVLTTGTDRTVHACVLATGEPLCPPVRLPEAGRAITATEDGFVVAYGDDVARLAWNLRTPPPPGPPAPSPPTPPFGDT